MLELILRIPGIRYKQLQRSTGLPNGSLSYILKKLETSRHLMVIRSKYSTAYYPKGVKPTKLHLIENLRNNIDRKIVQYLLDQGQCTFYDIVNHTERAPSTVSWHLNRLKNGKLVISTSYYGKPQTYKVINKNNVTKILSTQQLFKKRM